MFELRLVRPETEADRDPLAPIPFVPRDEERATRGVGRSAGLHPAEAAVERVQDRLDDLTQQLDVLARLSGPGRRTHDDGPWAA